MSYSDDAVRTKLSALNETQESIVTVAQWVMFHKRSATQIAQLWLQRLKDSGASKRLNLIYLANEVVQQSKVRRKDDFLVAFSPLVADATSLAYRGATAEVQQKLRRVVEVWRQRQIFGQRVQEAIEMQIDELDKNRPTSKKPLLGGSLFASSTSALPSELEPLGPLQSSVSKASVNMKSVVDDVHTDFAAQIGNVHQSGPRPVHAARLNSLLKSLVKAQSAVADSLRARQLLIGGLEKLVKDNQAVLADEERVNLDLRSKREKIELDKRDVEDAILQGLSAEEAAAQIEDAAALGDSPNDLTFRQVTGNDPFERPEMEPLTPPPVETVLEHTSSKAFEESTTPIGSPGYGNDPWAITSTTPFVAKPIPDHPKPDFYSSDMPAAAKRRKTSDAEFEAFGTGNALDELDDDVKSMLA